MARIVKDRIKQPSTTTGTGTITLSGSVAGFQAFSVLGDGSTTFYCIEDANGIAFEVGIGTYTGNTLARTTILESSSSGNAISLTSGTHTAFVTYPAERAGFNDEGLSPTLTASGTITAGKPVIQNTNGTVTQVAESASSEATPSASPIAVGAGTTYGLYTAYEPTSGKFVISYRDISNGNYPTIVAGGWNSASGTVTWGTAYVLASATTSNQPVVASGNGRIHVVYGLGGYSSAGDHLQNLRTATIASNNTFSGFSTSVVTFGSNIGGTYSGSVRLAFDTSTNYLISTYADATDGSGSYYVIPIHINGTTYTKGTVTTVCSGNPGGYRVGIVFDPDTNRTIIVYKDNGNSGYTTANVLQSAGSSGSPSLTMGSDVVIDSGDAGGTTSISYDTANNKVFLVYENSTDTELKGAIGTVTAGTNSISFTTPVSIKNTSSDYEDFDQIYDSDNNKIYLVYQDKDDGNDLTYVVITSSASSFSVSSATEISSTEFDIRSGAGAYASGKGAVFSLIDTTSSYALNYITFQNRLSTNLTSTNYFGVASNSATTTNPVQINVHGSINNAQTSLVVDKDYYTTNTGTIVTRLNGSGVVQATQFVGTALSATALELREFPASTIVGKADGTVTKGKPVIVEPDGDFKLVVESPESGSTPTVKFASVGQSNQTTNQTQPAMTYEATSGKYVMYYVNNQNSSYPTIAIGTWSNGTITWGTAIVITSLTNQDQMPITSGDGRIYMLLYNTGFGSTQLCVGTISGTSFSQTFRTTIQATATAGQKIAYSPTQDQVIMVYSRDNGGSKGYARTASISGAGALTAIGSEVLIENTNFHTDRGALTYDPDTDRALYTSFNGAQNDDGMAWVLQASGTASSPSVVVGTGTKWAGNDNVGYTASCYDTENNKMFIAYQNSAAGAVKGIIATINAGSNAVTFAGDATIWADHAGTFFSVAYDVDAKKITFWYRDDDNSDYLTYKIVTPSAASFTVANGAVLKTSDCRVGSNSAASGGAGKGVAVAVSDKATSPVGQIAYASTYFATINVTNLTAENYIGIAQETVSTGNDVKVTTISGVDANQSSLTPAQIYYVQGDGTLSTTAGSPSVVAGTAIASTQLLVSRS